MLSTKVVNQGQYIFREGDEGDNFYMIEEGEVECIKNASTTVLQLTPEVHVRDLAAG